MQNNDPLTLCAYDIMQNQLVTVPASDSLENAERTLTEAGISGAPVIDTSDRLLGVISVRDLVRHHTEDGDLPEGVAANVFDNEVIESEQVAFERPATGACVADLMSQDVVSVVPTASVPQIAARMVEANVHRVMVLDRDRLIGLVSSTELLKVLAKMG